MRSHQKVNHLGATVSNLVLFVFLQRAIAVQLKGVFLGLTSQALLLFSLDVVSKNPDAIHGDAK